MSNAALTAVVLIPFIVGIAIVWLTRNKPAARDPDTAAKQERAAQANGRPRTGMVQNLGGSLHEDTQHP